MGLSIVIGGDDPAGRALVRALESEQGFDVQSCASCDEAMGSRMLRDAEAIVTCSSVPPEQAMALASSVEQQDLGVSVVMIVPEVTTDVLRGAMKAGVREVLGASDGIDAIAASVAAAQAAASRRHSKEPAQRQAAEDARPAGKVITVFSTKGGVGKSVIATNIAVELAHGRGKSTVLVDLDLEFGDVSVMLRTPPERTIADAVQAFDRLDPEMLKGFLVRHDSGLYALLAPVQPEEADVVTANRVARIIGMLRQLADVVVIDTPASLSEVVLTALENSDLVIAVATMDVPSVKNTKVSLQKLHQLGLNNGSVQLVLNRADSKVWLEASEIEKAVSDKIVARVPSHRLVPRCVNKGVPVVLEAPRSAVAKSLVTLAHEVARS